MNATPATPNQSRFKKMLAGGLIAATAIGGAAAFAPTIASAQEAETEVESSETNEEGRRGRHGKRAAKLAILTDVLDVTVDELKAAREDGQTLAEIAGDDVDALIAAIVDAKSERIAAAVEAGRITQERADDKLAGLEEKVTEKVNAEPGERGSRGHRGHRGHRGDRPANDTADA